MIYLILARWGDSPDEELLIQHFKQGECYRYYCGLVKAAHEQKINVKYRMTEMEGHIPYTQEEIDSINKEKAKLETLANQGNNDAQRAMRQGGKIIT